MKTYFRIIASLSVLLGLAACQQFKIDTQITPEQAAGNIRLVCDALTSYNVPATNPGSVTFNITANTPWTIVRSSGADWCTVSPSSSANSALISDVVVSCETNTELEDRSATLTVRGENINKTYTITIRQDRQGKLFVTPVAQDYAAVGGPLNFTFTTNKAWEIHSSEGWLTFSRDAGEPDPESRTITIVATAAPSNVMERTATVTVVAGDDEESFEVTQKGKFDLAELSSNFASEGSTQVIRLRTDLPWEVACDKDWITFDPEQGTGTGVTVKINATAAPNDGATRKATILVRAGGAEKTFEVTQSGANFEIIAPASTAIPPKGGEMVLEVKSTVEWTPSTDVEGWTVTKVDDTHMKVKASFNNKFAPRKGYVTIKGEGMVAEQELTQDINFDFENVEVLSDGSVKIQSSQKARVTLKEAARYVSFVLEMGEVSFDSKAEFVLSCHDAAESGELQCQIRLGAGKNRLRTNGGSTEYNTADIGITVDQLNAIKTYRMDFVPNAEDPNKIDLEFFYNGESMAKLSSKSPYAGAPEASGHYFFGTEDASEGSASWYIVKSCTPTFIAE